MLEPFYEGVKPGGLTDSKDIRILLCYLFDSVSSPISRQQLEDVLLDEELVNYFAMAESLASLKKQGLITGTDAGYSITESGHTVAQTLAHDVPRTVRDTAVRGVIRAQQYATKAVANKSEVVTEGKTQLVRGTIGDDAGTLFKVELFMPDELTAQSVKEKFVTHGDIAYKLLLAALTDNRPLAEKALAEMEAE